MTSTKKPTETPGVKDIEDAEARLIKGGIAPKIDGDKERLRDRDDDGMIYGSSGNDIIRGGTLEDDR